MGRKLTSRTRIAAAAISTLLLVAGEFSLRAQLLHPKEPMPSFEVATIKRWKPPAAPAGPRPPEKVDPGKGPAPPVGDRVGFTGEIELLIESAYGLPLSSGNRILGGPGWIRDQSERYQIAAKIADGDYAAIQKMSAAEQREQVSLMQQALLADRFKFGAHIETRQMPRYVLAVASGGSKLELAQGDATSRMSLVTVGQHLELRATAITIEQLAQSPFLRIDQRQIVDKTSLVGRFSFTLKFTNGMAGVREDVSDAPELPTALQEQLGLKLVPESGPVEVIVIDHIERPSEN